MRTKTDNFEDEYGDGVCAELFNGEVVFYSGWLSVTKDQARQFAMQLLEMCEEDKENNDES